MYCHAGDRDWVYYTGSWTGERPEDGLQYFAKAAQVVATPANKLHQLRFSDGLMLRTKNSSPHHGGQPLLPAFQDGRSLAMMQREMLYRV